MFSSILAQDVTRQIWKDALYVANTQRKDDQEKRLDYYMDGQLAYVQQAIADRYDAPEEFQPVFFNIVKKIIKNLALVYIEPPKREVEGFEQDKALFDELARDCELSQVMKDASKLCKLLKTVLIRPVWRNGGLELDIIPPHLVDVETGDSPKDLKEVLITHYPESGRTEETTFTHWTPKRIATLDWRGSKVTEEPNPYGILPFVPLWDGRPLDTFWLQGGDDLIAIQDALNLELTELLHTLRLQGFGIPWIKGGDLGAVIGFGPGRAVGVPEGGDFGFAAPDAPIEAVVKVVDFMVKQAAITNGLSAASMSIEAQDESGLSKLVGNRELMEMRADDVELWRGYERRVFDVARTVWNYHNPGRKLSEGASLKVDFYDLAAPISEAEKRANWEADLAMGVISPVDVLMERNPDLKTREDALECLEGIERERARLGGQAVDANSSERY